ncbi:C2 domain-containing protein [Lactarius akahatsu]|uniref:C2 domain-containing protein n=1 Tax=Lactarius akahatsu TaxID=416441 RepID=A0AAD4LGB6_9AGAM|nr:C2 domain-containing protein [Lactarius akahatsu]
MSSSNTITNPSRTKRHHTCILCRGNSGDHLDETPIIIFRVQVILCNDLGTKGYNGSHDTSRLRSFVTVSYLGKRFQTPVFKRSHDELKDATFHFPICTSLVLKPSTLELVVWNKDVIRNKYLGECSLPVDPWSKETGFAFDDPSNERLSVTLVSSRPTTTAHGSICFKAGFVHPNSPASGRTLIDLVRAFPLSDNGHIGIVVLEICSAKDLPNWPNVTHTGWDVDPFVKVSTGNKVVGTTRVIKHSRYPVWNQQLDFPVRQSDKSIRLAVFDWDRFTYDDYIGEAEINISEFSEPVKNVFKVGLYPDDLPTMREFELPLNPVKKPGRVYKTHPVIKFRASYQPYGKLWNHVCDMDLTRKTSRGEPTSVPRSPGPASPTDSTQAPAYK